MEKNKVFYTPEQYASEQARQMDSSRGPLVIASCSSGTYLAEQTVQRYKQLSAESKSHSVPTYLKDIDHRFTDTETCVRLEHYVNGADVFLFQSLFNPLSGLSIDQNYMAFLIAVRAFREHGARHITGVLPYPAYARQDKPSAFKREPITAKLMADLALAAGIDRLIIWAPHSGQLRGFYNGITVYLLDPLTFFLDEFSRFEGRDDVIAVAPDAGASKFVTHFSRSLNINSAIASKYRPRAEEAIISEIIGDFRNKTTAIILDDMISNGGTIFALTKKLALEKGIREVYIGVSHNLSVGSAPERLAELHATCNLKQVVVTNSIPQAADFLALPMVKMKCLSDIFSRTINRIHYHKSVSEVFKSRLQKE
ncbi:MAG: ribose-phosphate pyrophosphokinase [Spirochaetales bacterium]|nr:ribose-phosphate pyrophosphokinase [Spirochaetales bacterium]